MRRFLRHVFYLTPAAMRLASAYLQAAWFWKMRAEKWLQLPAGAQLSPEQRRRWKQYFYGTTFLSAVFESLLGRGPRRQTEWLAFARLSALASRFDDLAENPGRANAPTPELFGRREDPSGIAGHLLQHVLENLPPGRRPAFEQYLNQIFQLETAGNYCSPTLPDLAAHSAAKGAASVLLFRCLLDEALDEPERQVLAAFGSWIQMADDIFDLWFDRRQQHRTLATELAGANQPEQLSAAFEKQRRVLRRQLEQAPASVYRRERSWRVLHFLGGITRVCLQHYLDLKKKRGTLPLDNRQAMVVDMARWHNRWRAARAVLFE